MKNFNTGWHRFWQTFTLPFWQTAGFVTALIVFDIIGEVIGTVLKAVWKAL